MKPRRWLGLAVLMVVMAGLLPWVRAAEKTDMVDRVTRDVTFLASDECEGRGVLTKGIHKAADHIAAEFKKAGLKPGGANGSYFQPFKMPAYKAGQAAELLEPARFVLTGPQGQQIDLPLSKSFQVVGFSPSAKVNAAPLVFVGYGATTEKMGYDDFQGVDVAGKVVVILRMVPRTESRLAPFEGVDKEGPNYGPHSALVAKIGNAAKNKAAAVLFVNEANNAKKDGDNLMPFARLASEDPASIPALHISRAVADMLLQSSTGRRLTDVEKEIDRTLSPQSTPLPGWTASLETNVHRSMIEAKNVVGVLEGAGPLANETIVIGAHYDHLGLSHPGSLSRDRKPQIHHGADDNASGTTIMMEMARRFGAMENRQGRRLVFVGFSGEESGLLGSKFYVEHPTIPLKDTVAMVNLDMVGRLRQDKDTGKDKLLVEGSGTAKTFDALLDGWAKKHDFKLTKKASGFGPSDHASFYGKKIPVIFYWTDIHPEYHRPGDTADKINVPGMLKIADLTEETVGYLAEIKDRPEYVEIKSQFQPGGQYAGVPRIGIQASYGDDGDGILLDGVAAGGPAEKAGLKGGDRILEIAGKPFKGMEGYMPLMVGRKTGEAVEFTVLRDGKKMTIKVVP